MNEVIQNMITRRSIRKFKSEMVPHNVIEQIIEAGLWAASGRNRQKVAIVAVTNRELRDRLSVANRSFGEWGPDVDPFYGAPVVLVVLALKSVPTYLYDGSLVMGNLMLAAHSLGIGSCWIHRAKQEFETEEYKQLLSDLGMEGEWEGIGHCVLGYADEVPQTLPRKEDRVFWVE